MSFQDATEWIRLSGAGLEAVMKAAKADSTALYRDLYAKPFGLRRLAAAPAKRSKRGGPLRASYRIERLSRRIAESNLAVDSGEISSLIERVRWMLSPAISRECIVSAISRNS